MSCFDSESLEVRGASVPASVHPWVLLIQTSAAELGLQPKKAALSCAAAVGGVNCTLQELPAVPARLRTG